MRATCPWLAWVGRERVVAVFAIGVFTVSAFGASSAVLFPKPLHLVRTIEDPLARGASTVHEYCAGNQVITVDGSRVAVADYDKQQLTEIDREAGTYSVTSFAEIARAHAKAPRAAKTNATAWNANQVGVRAAAAGGRSLESWRLVRDDAKEKATIDVGIDRRVALSRDAVEVLVGASYPHTRREEHDAILKASAGPAEARRQPMTNSVVSSEPQYGLPIEQVFTFESKGEKAGEVVAIRNTVREVNDDLPPADLLIIPPGSKLVESRVARMARELREADQLSIQKQSN